MNNAKKTEEKKAAAQKTATPAENKNAVKETAAAVVKTEAKTSAAAKSTAKKTAAPKTGKAAAKKADAKTTKAAKPDAKAAKPAAKSASKTAKTAVTTAAMKSAPAKKNAKKSITIDTICTKLDKKISKTKAAAVKEKVAVDIEVWGFEDGSNSKMYIEINNGKVTVAPHTYEEKNFRISLSFANAVAFVNGKLTLKSLIESKDFYAEGNIVSAIKLASVF